MRTLQKEIAWLALLAFFVVGCDSGSPSHMSDVGSSRTGPSSTSHAGPPDPEPSSGKPASESVYIEPALGYKRVFEETGVVEYEFTIFNRGDTPVHVAKVVPTCSCAAGRLSSNDIPPRGQASFHVEYDVLASFSELPKRKIAIVMDRPDQRTITCEVGGYRRQRYVLNPGSIDFGSVEAGRAESRELTITANGEDNRLVFEEGMATSPFVSAQLLKTTSTTDVASHRVRFDLSEKAPIGPIECKVFIPRQQNDGIGPQIWVRATIVGPARPVPPVAFFGMLHKQGKPATARVRLAPTAAVKKGEQPPAISHVLVEGLPEGVTADTSKDDPSSIDLTADPAKLEPGAFEKKAVISCQVGGRPARLDLSLKAMVLE